MEVDPFVGTVCDMGQKCGVVAEEGIGINDLRSVGNKSLREELIKLLMEKSNLSLRGIAETLELNREMVRKVSKDTLDTYDYT